MGFQVYNSQGQELQNLTGTAGGDLTGTYPNPTIAAQVLRTDEVLHVRDEKAAGTNGGGFANGAWRTRTLNTSVTNTISGASLSSNQITLPAGTYFVDGGAPAYVIDFHKAKLRNVTDSADSIIGTTAISGTGGYTTSWSHIRGLLVITAQKVFELQHRCSTSNNNVGCGDATNFGVTEIYSELLFWKVA